MVRVGGASVGLVRHRALNAWGRAVSDSGNGTADGPTEITAGVMGLG